MRKTEVKKIDGIPWVPTFWKHRSGSYVLTCPLGSDDFEVAARIRRSEPDGHRSVSWAHPFDLRTLLHEFDDFCLPVRQILRLAAEGEVQEFPLCSGQRLKRMISQGNIALVGDASHALLGNFGSGAGFALEDVYALAKSLNWGQMRQRPLPEALDLFDSIRSPHYKHIYDVCDDIASIKAEIRGKDLSIDKDIAERVERISIPYYEEIDKMYHKEIDNVVAAAVRQADQRLREAVCDDNDNDGDNDNRTHQSFRIFEDGIAAGTGSEAGPP